MKQIIQNFKIGETNLDKPNAPQVKVGYVQIQTSHFMVSLNTERILIVFSHAGIIQNALQQPDKVRMVLSMILNDGAEVFSLSIF